VPAGRKIKRPTRRRPMRNLMRADINSFMENTFYTQNNMEKTTHQANYPS
jgi:hypothetical protein